MEITIQILGTVGTIIAILFAVFQFYKLQKWQKSEFLLKLINEFEENVYIASVKLMLDWDERDIFVENKKLVFNNELLLKALIVPKFDDNCFNEEEKIVRDAFDAFFDYFHKLYSFSVNNVINFKDLTYFYYYFELLHNISEYKGDEKYKEIINNYIQDYKFIGIQYFLKQYCNNKKTQQKLILPDA
ncbi:MAG: hypothetical protein LBV69_04820 [Bacteroidales bacterium]|jgi:hypothetical protein|nr:hypothetical protein [Bacteroidales bacterium]